MDEVILGANQWVAIITAVLGGFGLFIANLFQAMKARAEAQKTREEAKEISKHQEAVLSQFKNNGGSSMKDATDRIEAQLKTIRGELGFQRREILRLAEVDDQDRELTNEIYKDIQKSFVKIETDLKNHIDNTSNAVDRVQKEVLDILKKRKQDATKQ